MQSQEQTIDYVSRDFINPPIMISKNKKMVDVIEKLTEMGISRLIVHDSRKPIGIITTKDWLIFS
ncbi:MAG: CBS domain-containing protein [Nitrosopumilus sp.]|nr:CBS domain-containing protein [Nitrosopumilus sp.]